MALFDPTLLKARLGLLAGRFDVDALDECDSTSSELARADMAVGARGQPDLFTALAFQRAARATCRIVAGGRRRAGGVRWGWGAVALCVFY